MSVSIGSIPQPLRTVAASHGWSGEDNDRRGLADALEIASKALPKQTLGSMTLNQLVDDLYVMQNALLVSHTISLSEQSPLPVSSTIHHASVDDQIELGKPYVGTVFQHRKEGDGYLFTMAIEDFPPQPDPRIVNSILFYATEGQMPDGQPELLIGGRVRVVLGDEKWEDAYGRHATSLEFATKDYQAH